MNLETKIELAQNVLRTEYENNNGKIFISFSGGKDSTILRHIALGLYPDLNVVFSNTTNELTEVYKYVKTFENVIHVTPKMSFSEVVQKHGFPLVSKEVSQKVSELKNTQGETTRTTRFSGDSKGNGRLATKWRFLAEEEFNVTHKCCQILKKDPLEKWAKEHGMKPVIALMADESALRKQLSLFGKGDKKVYPFLKTGWEEADIWAYAEKFNITFAECYYDRIIDGKFLKAKTRTGCEYCAFGIHLEENDRFERSKLLAPKRFEKMMNLENNGYKFSEVIAMVKQEHTPKPKLDLYGVKMMDSIKTNVASNFFIEKRHDIKKCKCCSSKNIRIIESFSQSFFDSPFQGKPRKLWVARDKFECSDCKTKFLSDTPMINEELNSTYRLLDYVDSIKDTRSFDYLIETTHINRVQALAIVRHLVAKSKLKVTA